MVADSVEYLRGHGLGVMFDAEHFFDGYKRNPEFALRVLEAAAEKGASTLVLCDTNGGSLPFEVEQIVGDVVSHFRNDVIVCDPHARRHRLRGRQRARGSAGGRPAGAGHDQRHRRAHRQLQPHHGDPEPHAEDGDRDDPGRPPGTAHVGGAPHRRARQRHSEPAGALRRIVGVRAQGRPPRERDREAARCVRAHPPRHRGQRHSLRRVRARRQGDPQVQGRGARARPGRQGARRRRRHVEATRARGLPLRSRGRLARAA